MIFCRYQFLLFFLVVFEHESEAQDGNAVAYQKSNAFPLPVTRAVHEFAFEMFRKAIEQPNSRKNIIFSPLSMYSIFSALLPGLDGESLSEVKRLLRAEHLSNITVEESDMTDKVFNLSNHLYTLEHTQRLFIDRRIRLRKHFKKMTEGYHRALIKKLDFRSSPETCRNKINRYVAKKTREDVTNILEEDSINERTKLVLVNTIYIQAPWKNPFPRSSTTIKHFNVSESEQIEIPFMLNRDGLCSKPMRSNNLNSDVYVIPFESNVLTMVIFMPNPAGGFQAFKAASATRHVQQTLEKLWRRHHPTLHSCRLLMPKFVIDYKMPDMKSVLNAMGVRNLFLETSADLSRLTSSDGVYVSDVQHATVIKTNEEGVQASAAASISTVWKSVPYTVNLNKPFVFMIRHEFTGSILFLGKVIRPEV